MDNLQGHHGADSRSTSTDSDDARSLPSVPSVRMASVHPGAPLGIPLDTDTDSYLPLHDLSATLPQPPSMLASDQRWNDSSLASAASPDPTEVRRQTLPAQVPRTSLPKHPFHSPGVPGPSLASADQTDLSPKPPRVPELGRGPTSVASSIPLDVLRHRRISSTTSANLSLADYDQEESSSLGFTRHRRVHSQNTARQQKARRPDATANSGHAQTKTTVRRGRSQGHRYQRKMIRDADFVRVTAHNRRDRAFANLVRLQDFEAHAGPIWTMEFSTQGNFLATAGADTVVHVWRTNKDVVVIEEPDTPSPQEERRARPQTRSLRHLIDSHKPFRTYTGHQSDVTILDWSKNEFLLSGSTDNTIRLWYPATTSACLRRFDHGDLVTALNFHPIDENVFVSGSVGGTVRLWSIPSGRCLAEVDTDEVITAISVATEGQQVLIGTASGHCKFFGLHNEMTGGWNLRHVTQLDVRPKRSSKSRNISTIKSVSDIDEVCQRGFEDPARTNALSEQSQFIISSNDSVIRLYRMDDKALEAEYSGHQNTRSHFPVSWSPNKAYILSASENREVYIWEIVHLDENIASKRGRSNQSYEAFTAADARVTSAHFFPQVCHVNSNTLPSPALGLSIAVSTSQGSIHVFHNVDTSAG